MTIRVACLTTMILVVVLVTLTFHYKAPDYRLSLSQTFHIGLQNGGAQHWEPFTTWVQDPRIAFYNAGEYGPYSGSIIGFVGDKYPIKTGFGDWWGIYYRHFEWQDGSVLWTLKFNLWHLFNIATITLFFVTARRSNHSICDLLVAMTMCAVTLAAFPYLRGLDPLGITCLLLAITTAGLTSRFCKLVLGAVRRT